MNSLSDWKTKTFIIGGVIGLLAGIFAAHIVIQQSEKRQTLPVVTAKDGVKVGLGLLTFFRLVSDIANQD